MPKKTYRALAQWDKWLRLPQGELLLENEAQILSQVLEKLYGKHCLLLGSPHQQALLDTCLMPHHLLLSPLVSKGAQIRHIESEFYELPIASNSVDLVLVPHTLEHLDNPRQLLLEGCRIVKPDGHIIIFGFNPFGVWGLKKRLMKNPESPWLGNFVTSNTIKKWLQLAEFQLILQEGLLFRPYLTKSTLYQNLKFLEWIGRYCFPNLGGVYMLMAQNKSIPLLSIKTHWRQHIAGVKVSLS